MSDHFEEIITQRWARGEISTRAAIDAIIECRQRAKAAEFNMIPDFSLEELEEAKRIIGEE